MTVVEAKFYICISHHVMIYESKEIADAQLKLVVKKVPGNLLKYSNHLARFGHGTLYGINYARKQIVDTLKTNVFYVKRHELFYMINKDENLWQVIVEEKTGWLIPRDWMILVPIISHDDFEKFKKHYEYHDL